MAECSCSCVHPLLKKLPLPRICLFSLIDSNWHIYRADLAIDEELAERMTLQKD